nr:hypothetical protein [uncultured Shinella sp.]
MANEELIHVSFYGPSTRPAAEARTFVPTPILSLSLTSFLKVHEWEKKRAARVAAKKPKAWEKFRRKLNGGLILSANA